MRAGDYHVVDPGPTRKKERRAMGPITRNRSQEWAPGAKKRSQKSYVPSGKARVICCKSFRVTVQMTWDFGETRVLTRDGRQDAISVERGSLEGGRCYKQAVTAQLATNTFCQAMGKRGTKDDWFPGVEEENDELDNSTGNAQAIEYPRNIRPSVTFGRVATQATDG